MIELREQKERMVEVSNGQEREQDKKYGLECFHFSLLNSFLKLIVPENS
jgi:hypothetical protein